MSWPTVKLGDLCEISRGGSPRPIQSYLTDAEDGLNWIKIGDVRVGEKYIASTEEKIKPSGLSATRQVQPGDFLLSNSMSFGRPYISKINGCIHDGWLMLRDTNNHFSQDYLYHMLSSPALKAQFKKFATGAVVKNLNKDVVANVLVPLPPIAQQKRIAAILDKTAEIKAKRELAIVKLDELRKCVFNDLLQKNQDNVTIVKLGTVCNFVRGPFGGALKKEIFKNDGYAVYEQQHAIYDQFTDVRYYVDRAKFEEMKRFELRAGDLIMSCSGTMGKVAIVPEGIRQGIINQALLKLTPTNKLNVRYLKEYMEGSLFQASLENETHGAAIKNVASVSVLKELPIALPTLDVQNEIANVVGKLFGLLKVNNEYLEKESVLINSLQHQAFKTGFGE